MYEVYMEQIHTQVKWSIGCLFTSEQKVKRWPIDHLIKLACVFVPYRPHILAYNNMYHKHT